jgi:Gelsolin repeat
LCTGEREAVIAKEIHSFR